MQLPSILLTISQMLQSHHAKAIVVGGSVRDHFLQHPIKDYDIEVYGVESLEQLAKLLHPYGTVNLVGKSFGVLKLTVAGEVYDFSLPRTESKVAQGHRGFSITTDSHLSFEEASRRRDFTLNAMGYDISTGSFLDPHGGQRDLATRTLRHIDATRFVEDPLRVYRAVQFCARFGLTLHTQTHQLCETMVTQGLLEELPKERIFEEFDKLLHAPTPSVGFELLARLGILRYFPELEAIRGIPQPPRYHPEGDVWVHTMMALDTMARLLKHRPTTPLERRIYLFTILCHDLGKAKTTTQASDGKIHAHGHAQAGITPATALIQRLTDNQALLAGVLPLVAHHMVPSQLYTSHTPITQSIRTLATKVTISTLLLVSRADFLGRTTPQAKQGIYPAGEWLEAEADKLGVLHHPLPPLLQGRDLIAVGLTPSPVFKAILAQSYQYQLEGRIHTKAEALALLTRCE